MFKINHWLINKAAKKSPLSIVYHSISESNNIPQWPWEVTLEQFEQQLDLLLSQGWQTCCFRDLSHPEKLSEKTVLITFDDGYENNFAAAQALHKRGMCATWFIVSNDIGGISSWSDPGTMPRTMLSAEQLLEMDEMGMEIGAHTMSHCKLAQVSLEQAVQEVTESKSKLTQIMGKEVISFCYPYGNHNDNVVEAVRTAGYKYACVTFNGWVNYDPDPLRIRRIAIYAADSLSLFAFKLYMMTSKTDVKALILSVIRLNFRSIFRQKFRSFAARFNI